MKSFRSDGSTNFLGDEGDPRKLSACFARDRRSAWRALPARRASEASPFIHRELQLWFREQGIKTLSIDSGSPWQNGFIDCFYARLRDECPEREQLWTLSDTRVVIEDWRHQYHQIRPHRSLGFQTPMGLAVTTSQAAARPVGLRPP